MLRQEGTEFWHEVATLEQLDVGDRIVIKVKNRQIAVFRTDDDFFAINNRCPHEGYPLSEGTLKDGCRLACNWHGWTFDLKSGEALQGRDAVKTYPVKTEGQTVLIKIVPPDMQIVRKTAMHDFEEAFEEHDYERMARSLCRYEEAEGQLEDVAINVLKSSLFALERGFGHAHAGLADWISLAGEDASLRLVAFLEALGHFSWDSKFSQAPTALAAATEWNEDEFIVAIEAMDQTKALSLCRGAFVGGLEFSEIKALLLRQNFTHYAGFGHPAIYLMKSEQLLMRFGQVIEEELCLLLTRYWCLAAREDLIPEFKVFGDLLEREPVGDVAALPEAGILSGIGTRKLLPLVDGSPESNFEKWEALLAASAVSMLRFDEELQNGVEQPIAKNVGWLDFTHVITFSEALYFHAQDDERLWRSGLLQQACFIGRNSGFLQSNVVPGFEVLDKYTFFSGQKAALFDMDEGEYIYSVHRLKMVTAVEKLVELVSQDTADLLMTALNRYLSSALRQKHPARTIMQARATVLRE